MNKKATIAWAIMIYLFACAILQACNLTLGEDYTVKELSRRIDSLERRNAHLEADRDSARGALDNSLKATSSGEITGETEVGQELINRLKNRLKTPRYVYGVLAFTSEKYKPNPYYNRSITIDRQTYTDTRQFTREGLDTFYYTTGIQEVSHWSEDDKYRLLDEIEATFVKERIGGRIFHREVYKFGNYAEASRSLEKWKQY